MNQQCKVCGEPAAGFHFGAFTCEGCKSFFGRSYNNLSSISECKNNGECVINKKNRTACKACRLRKCLLVGMSKSGSRYGRRSNWFKIHCLLQEQQQAAAAAHQNGSQKPPAPMSPNTLNLMGHPSYPPGLFSRPPCTKEELMLLGLDEYTKHPKSAASPSISSPDSHNSDSSIEVGDKRNSLLNHKTNKMLPNTPQQTPMGLNKLDFLPLPFAGLPLMPPPGFLPPPTHLLFSSYHNALYQHHHHQMQQQQQAAQQQQQHLQHQGLLLKTTEPSHVNPSPSPPSHSYEHNNNHISKSNEKFAKRFFLDAVLESQKKQSLCPSPLTTKIPKRSLSPVITNGSQNGNDHEEEDIDMEDDEEVLTMTPPRSPTSPPTRTIVHQHNPIDLSMKSTSSTKSDDINHNNHYKNHMNNKNYHRSSTSDNSSMDGHSTASHSDNESNDNKLNDNNVDIEHKINHYKSNLSSKNNDKNYNNLNGNESEEDNNSNNNNNDTEYTVEIKRKKLQQTTTTPLDLTTKV